MYRIRLHGRGGQGTKTAGRILGSAFFSEGFEVQDAPRYGAERRGAPIFSYVRAAHRRIDERGVIAHPDLVVVADESLVELGEAGVLLGLGPLATLLVASNHDADAWRARLRSHARIITLPVTSSDVFASTACVGAAARLVGVIARGTLERAVRHELSGFASGVVERDVSVALAAFDAMADHAGLVEPGPDHAGEVGARPGWVEPSLDSPHLAAPTIHGGATSLAARTGLWRTSRPEIDPALCHHCAWICSTLCPDGVITANGGVPAIDLEHCKGCMICVEQCPWHAINARPEGSVRP